MSTPLTQRRKPMFTTSKKSSLAVIITSLGVVACTSQMASAGWAQNHPRRAEVNARLEVQNWRINQAHSHGKITPAQASALHAQDQLISTEERFEEGRSGMRDAGDEVADRIGPAIGANHSA